MRELSSTRRLGRTGRAAYAALRFCVAIVLMLQIVGTAFHVHLEPHSDLEVPHWNATLPEVTPIVGCKGHESDSDHERHSAAQHDLKALRTHRALTAELPIVAFTESLAAPKDCPGQRVLVFSGLSPPELPRSWQFAFRAALPVRAPSLPS